MLRKLTDGELVEAAKAHDQDAWDELVARFSGRVWAVARAHGLSRADGQDVHQLTWLRLLTRLDSIREPEKIGAWLATTARNESLRLLARGGRLVPTGEAGDFDTSDPLASPIDTALLRDERQAAVWRGLAKISPDCQRLLRFLMADPPPTYEEVIAGLGMPQGSIGPTRRRCLDRLRRHLEDAERGGGITAPRGGS